MSARDLKEQVSKVVAEELAPLLAMDGGRIEIVDVQDGVLQVRLLGSCASCPSTLYAVIMGVEEELRKHVPGVEYLEAVP